MGKRGGFKKGGRGRGGWGGDRRPRPDNRTDKATIKRENDRFEQYYDLLGLVPNDDKEEFWEVLRRDLPNSFRFTGSRAHALAVQKRLIEYYIPEITSITFDGEFVPAPKPVDWYPDQLAWYMTTPKHIIRRFAPFKSFQTFLVAETDVGNITRQEIVSMIPPLCMDIKPHHAVLDLCAAPGSKSAQIIEMLHSGEEERSQQVSVRFAQGLDKPPDVEYNDDVRSTGILIANDVDYKRAHMLVHQVKRLSSPNILVTNHDATVFPSIKIPAVKVEGKPVYNKYLKFDRILADVPCSGDGTARKNLEIWQKWNPSNGLGLHATQVRILMRALQMLKVGGRVVYSTCSMNPVEDEAVVASAIQRCGGLDLVQIIDSKEYLPGLKRYPGLKKWSVMDKKGRIWQDHRSVIRQMDESGDEGLGRLLVGMFPPKEDLHLERAMRVYAHQQDTGAFFICILEKRAEFKVATSTKESNGSTAVKTEAIGIDGTSLELETAGNGEVEAVHASNGNITKRKSESDDIEPPSKRIKQDDGAPLTQQKEIKEEEDGLQHAVQRGRNAQISSKPRRDQPFEEPFKYLQSSNVALTSIFDFYKVSDRFPRDRFLVRNPEGNATKNIYYTTSLAKDILTENEGKGMKFVHAGVKMFVKQDAPSPEVCPWRIQTDGLKIVEPWVGTQRVVKLWKKETLRKLLIEMFPRFHGDAWKQLGEIGEQVLNIGMGCCVLIVEPREGELTERMVFPLWKSVQSLNLMLPKEERKAMLLRIFNDESDLINIQQNPGGMRPPKQEKHDPPVLLNSQETEESEKAVDEKVPAVNGRERKNSSSVEPDLKDEEEQYVNDDDEV